VLCFGEDVLFVNAFRRVVFRPPVTPLRRAHARTLSPSQLPNGYATPQKQDKKDDHSDDQDQARGDMDAAICFDSHRRHTSTHTHARTHTHTHVPAHQRERLDPTPKEESEEHD